MARTYRRRRGRKRSLDSLTTTLPWISHHSSQTRLDPQSPEASRLRARYHSDAYMLWRGSPPRWFRKIYDRSIRNANRSELRRWLRCRDFDPVFQNGHRHNARRDWW